jgi:hypothetical protein
MSEDFAQPPPISPQPPSRHFGLVVGIQLLILLLINVIGIVYRLVVGTNDAAIAQLFLMVVASLLQAGLLFVVAVILSIMGKPTAPSWWIAFGAVFLLALPTCLGGYFLGEEIMKLAP